MKQQNWDRKLCDESYQFQKFEGSSKILHQETNDKINNRHKRDSFSKNTVFPVTETQYKTGLPKSHNWTVQWTFKLKIPNDGKKLQHEEDIFDSESNPILHA